MWKFLLSLGNTQFSYIPLDGSEITYCYSAIPLALAQRKTDSNSIMFLLISPCQSKALWLTCLLLIISQSRPSVAALLLFDSTLDVITTFQRRIRFSLRCIEKKKKNMRCAKKPKMWVESDCSGGAWDEQSDGCENEWTVVVLLLTQWV